MADRIVKKYESQIVTMYLLFLDKINDVNFFDDIEQSTMNKIEKEQRKYKNGDGYYNILRKP